jgi:hypothetical protein
MTKLEMTLELQQLRKKLETITEEVKSLEAMTAPAKRKPARFRLRKRLTYKAPK